MEGIKMKFKDAPIGARFRYPGADSIEVWVKINSYPKSRFNDGDGLIVKWNGNVEGFQSSACFVDHQNGISYDTEIELL